MIHFPGPFVQKGGGNRVPLSYGPGGAPTPDTATFCKICMSKRKNWDP